MPMKPRAMIRTMAIMKTADILKAMDITEELAKRMGFLPRDCLFLRLATEEACTNAYEYCQKTRRLPFRIFWKIDARQFMIIVKQRGGCFSVAQTDVVNTGPRGRGLQLIAHIVDDVYVKRAGNNVLLCMCKCKKKSDHWRKQDGDKTRGNLHADMDRRYYLKQRRIVPSSAGKVAGQTSGPIDRQHGEGQIH
ncbi:ATP-binding protein [Geobacillus sp. LEMMY01]|uniref:ATP-binding protein n=1 Tax=Geobacillus sp. LEMMY01 TaxID=1954237 RepID=UPI0034C683D3